MDRIHKSTGSTEKKRHSGGSQSTEDNTQYDSATATDQNEQSDAKSTTSSSSDDGEGRQVYFNLPLPDNLKDDEGLPIHTYARNKIRTAKYTPLSFIPKNLWFQFHNIANIFFLFMVILVVSINPSNSVFYCIVDNSSHPVPFLDLSHFWRSQSRTQRCAFDIHLSRDIRQRRD